LSKYRKPNSSKGLAVLAARIADDKIAKDILILNLTKIHEAPSDYFVICSCDSENQMRAIVEAVEEGCLEVGLKRPKVEGYTSSSWIILDFFDVVMHIMLRASREFYNIERIWNDAQFAVLDDEGKPKTVKDYRLATKFA